MILQTTAQGKPTLEISASRQFTSWLYEQNVSFAFTTYQVGKLLFVGLQSNGKLSIFERTFDRCMGLYSHSDGLYMTSSYQLWRFQNSLDPGQTHNGYDAIYLPQMSYVTGDLDIHDLAICDSPYQISNSPTSYLPARRPIFINTLFSCLAAISETHSFLPLCWSLD